MSSFPRSARYRIKHRTQYKYSDSVAICRNQLRMMPRSASTAVMDVICHSSGINVDPTPGSALEHIDYFGNRVTSFSIESIHRELTVTANSEVSVNCKLDVLELQSDRWDLIGQRIDNGLDPSWLSVQEYRFDSPRITRGDAFAEFARPSFPEGRPIIQGAFDLTQRIYKEFRYDVDATDVFTTTEQAFRSKAGVCQDFAHVQIACLRSIGIPARYVSGYLRTVVPEGTERLVGADESHAWVSIYTGESFGWIDFDPTNNCPANENHIPIAIGRDFSEVSPMRGVVIGGGTAALSVSVDVAPIEEPVAN